MLYSNHFILFVKYFKLIHYLIIKLEKDYDEKCDVYSYTVIAWEVMVRLHPYFHLKEINQFKLMLGVHKGLPFLK